jgi:hypothetical protein
MTKTGNANARRLLTEAAWSYRFQPLIGYRAQRRAEELPQALRDIAWKAQLRLTGRFARLRAHGVQISCSPCRVRNSATSASIACASNARAPSRSTSVNASRTPFATPGFFNANTLSLLTAYSLLCKKVDDLGRPSKNTPPSHFTSYTTFEHSSWIHSDRPWLKADHRATHRQCDSRIYRLLSKLRIGSQSHAPAEGWRQRTEVRSGAVRGPQLSTGRRSLKNECELDGPLPQLLLRYTRALVAQTGQVAVCYRHHSLEQRLCRWILLCLDQLASNEPAMTHELLADMLGVRRETVAQAAGKLQRAGLAHCRHGRIAVLDRCRLEARVASAMRSSGV